MPSEGMEPQFIHSKGDSAKKAMADLFYAAAQSPLMERLNSREAAELIRALIDGGDDDDE